MRTVTLSAIDPHRPQDPRQGFVETVIRTDARGVRLDGRTATGEWFAVSDCFHMGLIPPGAQHTRIVVDGAQFASALDLLVAVSSALSCPKLSILALTECLGLADDPVACREGHGESA